MWQQETHYFIQEGYSKPSFNPMTAEEEERGMREVRRIAVLREILGTHQ